MCCPTLADQKRTRTPTRCSLSILGRGAEAFGFDGFEKEAQSCCQLQVVALEKASEEMMIRVVKGQLDQVLG